METFFSVSFVIIMVCVSAYAIAGTDVPIKDKDDKEAQDKLFRHFVVWAIVLGAFYAKIFLRW